MANEMIVTFWEHVIIALLAGIPAILAAVTALILALRNSRAINNHKKEHQNEEASGV